jgi:hypothetical protein
MDSEIKMHEVRKAAWSGQFYPASPAELSRAIAAMFAQAPKPDIPGDIVGLVSPHAGYMYSGQIAANTYKALQGLQYDTVIIVSPSHTKYFGGVSIYNGGAYETPLGSVATDVQAAKRLVRIAPNTIYFSNMGHTGGAQAEHALEVQLPFLQIVLGSFRLVALVMGEQDQWRTLGDALAGAASESRTLLVASSDLSHYYSASVAARLDGAVQSAVESFDPSGLAHVFETGKGEACGAGPILACMHAARKLGADQAVVAGYNHSGAVTGDDSGVVGYLGALFVRTGASREENVYTLQTDESQPGLLSEQDRDELRRLARQAVAAAVYNASPPQTSGAPRSLRDRRGAFVTLKMNGELRGCIGHVEGHRPLVETVVQMATAAATRDPRFVPVTSTDLPDIEIEVSALTPLVRCDDPETIEVGRHGVVLVKGNRSGVLLPQVAAEHGWDRVTFLHQVCLKAGLPPEAWRDSAATLYVFEAEVF